MTIVLVLLRSPYTLFRYHYILCQFVPWRMKAGTNNGESFCTRRHYYRTAYGCNHNSGAHVFAPATSYLAKYQWWTPCQPLLSSSEKIEKDDMMTSSYISSFKTLKCDNAWQNNLVSGMFDNHICKTSYKTNYVGVYSHHFL